MTAPKKPCEHCSRPARPGMKLCGQCGFGRSALTSSYDVQQGSWDRRQNSQS